MTAKIIQFPNVKELHRRQEQENKLMKAIRSWELEAYGEKPTVSLGSCLVLSKYGIWERVS